MRDGYRFQVAQRGLQQEVRVSCLRFPGGFWRSPVLRGSEGSAGTRLLNHQLQEAGEGKGHAEDRTSPSPTRGQSRLRGGGAAGCGAFPGEVCRQDLQTPQSLRQSLGGRGPRDCSPRLPLGRGPPPKSFLCGHGFCCPIVSRTLTVRLCPPTVLRSLRDQGDPPWRWPHPSSLAVQPRGWHTCPRMWGACGLWGTMGCIRTRAHREDWAA